MEFARSIKNINGYFDGTLLMFQKLSVAVIHFDLYVITSLTSPLNFINGAL